MEVGLVVGEAHYGSGCYQLSLLGEYLKCMCVCPKRMRAAANRHRMLNAQHQDCAHPGKGTKPHIATPLSSIQGACQVCRKRTLKPAQLAFKT